MDLSQYAELFLAESREHLGACNTWLLAWERDPAATEPVRGLFRSVHTIKGMAATMGYGGVAELAHGMENLLDRLRRGVGAPSPQLIQTLLDLGLDINAKDDDGLTALDYAMGRGYVPFLQMPVPANKPLADSLRRLGANVELDKIPDWPPQGPPIATAVYDSVLWPVDPVGP